MRILHISTRLILGGSQENTVLSCEGQARLGHEVHLAFGPIYGPEGSLLARVEGFNARCTHGAERTCFGEACRPIGIHVVSHLEREIRPRADLACHGELKRLVTSLGPDVVHTHSSKAGILGRLSAWSVMKSSGAGKPLVVHTIHGPPFHRYQSAMKNAIYIAAERWAARRCHVIVSVADAMTDQFRAAKIGRDGQYVTVYSGMEVEKYLDAAPGEDRESMRRELGLHPADLVLGTVARLAELKGHDDLLEALGEKLKQNPRWKLLWVGNGWWRDRLLSRARGMGLGVVERDRGQTGPGQVIVTGLVPSERVPAMMRAMDVLVHPSYREGLPRTVPQGLLCGVPVVAYDVDGTGEICRDDETGLLVDCGDIEGLELAIDWMAEHPDERAALAARGREECRVKFSAATMVDDLELVYRAGLEGRSAADAVKGGAG
ncbi:MAG: glycosyltransferase [Phycisphaeraceae bacterium]|nr:glycosyltransferase [Phycisphaeraceae bacterium]